MKVLFCIILFVSYNLAHSDEKRARLEVIFHKACKTATKSNIIEISNSDRSPLNEIADSPGCYELSLDVNNDKTIRLSDIQFFVDARSSEDETDRHPCHSPQEDGCGGVGSCLYCNPCSLAKSDAITGLLKLGYREKVSSGQWGPIKVALKCEEEIFDPANRKLLLKFCAPTKSQYLEFFKLDKETLDDIGNQLSLYLTIYFFNQPVNKQLQLLRYVQDRYREGTNNALLPEYLKFANIVPQNKGGIKYVGCHKIVANVLL